MTETETRIVFHAPGQPGIGPISEFMRAEARHVDLEGAFRSGKTTAALWKIRISTIQHPGIYWLACRYGDEQTETILRPIWLEICRTSGEPITWDPQAKCYAFRNGSRVYMHGIKAQDQLTRYAKIRGKTLAGIYVDQAEELPDDIYHEMAGRLSQAGQPHQILLTPNPPPPDHWLATEFPEDNRYPDHLYLHASIHDNAHNLPAETIADLIATYPPGHAKHQSAVLGLRGLNTSGRLVYGCQDRHDPATAMFRRDLHERSVAMEPTVPLLESWDFGRSHPCVVWAQFLATDQLRILGGIMGQNLFLEDFAPIVLRHRTDWFGPEPHVLACCDPAGSHHSSQGLRENAIKILNDLGIHPSWKDNGNAPDVRYAMIQRLAAYMRKRTPWGEGFAIDRDRWVLVSQQRGPVRNTFLADGLQAGITWDVHPVSVGNKQVDRTCKDGWYEHGENCLEYLEHNFGGPQPTREQRERQADRQTRRQVRLAQLDRNDPFRWNQSQEAGRGGYA